MNPVDVYRNLPHEETDMIKERLLELFQLELKRNFPDSYQDFTIEDIFDVLETGKKTRLWLNNQLTPLYVESKFFGEGYRIKARIEIYFYTKTKVWGFTRLQQIPPDMAIEAIKSLAVND